MRIVVIGAPDLVGELASHLRIDAVRSLDQIARDDFVMDGTALSVFDARALDVVLRGRGTEVDAVLAIDGTNPAIEDHYFGRVVEIVGPDRLGSALDALREILLVA